MPETDAPRPWGCFLLCTASLVALTLLDGPALAQTPPKTPSRKDKSMAIDVAPSLGAMVRLGDAPAFDVTHRGALTVGASASYYFHPIALGLTYEHAGFGREESGIGALGVVRIARQLDTVWAFARVRVTGLEPAVPFIQAGPGVVWQTARADGVVFSNRGVAGGQPFGCRASDSANLGLRVGWGVELPLSPSVLFLGEGSFDAYRLSTDIIDSCAPGAGTASALSFRLGLAYRFDLDGGGKKTAAK
jgi:opacity protein-like surface antigen